MGGTGIRQNPEESRGIRGKYRKSCPTRIPGKNSCDSGKNQEFLQPPPKPRSCEKFLRKTQEKKEILRNPGRNGFFGPKNKFLKTGICNLVKIQSHVLLAPGALFTVENPSVVQKWMANGTVPLIFTAQSIKSVLHENKIQVTEGVRAYP